jgi:hypothetical protein
MQERMGHVRGHVHAGWRTLRVSETSGAGISTTQVCVATPHPSTAGRHLHRGIDLRSYDSESTRGPPENSGAGVPGVAGADPFGGVDPAGSITDDLELYLLPLFLSHSQTLSLFLVFFRPLAQQQK